MLDEITVSMGLLELNRYPLQMHSILRRLFGYAKHKARTVASSGLGRVAWLRTYLRAGGTSVQLPCATSDAGLLDFVAAWYVKAVPYLKANPACRAALCALFYERRTGRILSLHIHGAVQLAERDAQAAHRLYRCADHLWFVRQRKNTRARSVGVVNAGEALEVVERKRDFFHQHAQIEDALSVAAAMECDPHTFLGLPLGFKVSPVQKGPQRIFFFRGCGEIGNAIHLAQRRISRFLGLSFKSPSIFPGASLHWGANFH